MADNAVKLVNSRNVCWCWIESVTYSLGDSVSLTLKVIWAQHTTLHQRSFGWNLVVNQSISGRLVYYCMYSLVASYRSVARGNVSLIPSSVARTV